MHECRRLCEYPDILIDDGNADERGFRRRHRGDVARWCGSRTGLAAGWRCGDDLGCRAVQQRRGGDIVVADVFAELPDCGGWWRDSRCEQWRWIESDGVFI